jgi:predicted RNA-binding protein with PIN domain
MPLAGIDGGGLADLIAGSRFAGETTWLVCDGTGGPEAARLRGRIVTHYAGRGSEADDRIGRMIDASSSPRRLTVVSSDHRVRRMAQRRRCAWLSAESFLSQLVDDSNARSTRRAMRPPVPLDRRQVDRWVRSFGLDAALLEIPASERPSSSRLHIAPMDGSAAKNSSNPRHPPSVDRDAPPTGRDVSPREPDPSPTGRRRALEGVERLDQVDPAELDRFDMSEWLPPEEPTRRERRAARRGRSRRKE